MEHFYQDIPGGFDFKHLYRQVAREMPDGALIAEVGCWLGRSTAYLAVECINSGKSFTLYAVDSWSDVPEERLLQPYGPPYPRFLREMMRHPEIRQHVVPIREKSVAAAALFRDESLYFCFIDAAHDYENVKADIKAWRRKVAPGGMLAGHDIDGDGVAKAVIEAGFEWRAVLARDAMHPCWEANPTKVGPFGDKT